MTREIDEIIADYERQAHTAIAAEAEEDRLFDKVVDELMGHLPTMTAADAELYKRSYPYRNIDAVGRFRMLAEGANGAKELKYYKGRNVDICYDDTGGELSLVITAWRFSPRDFGWPPAWRGEEDGIVIQVPAEFLGMGGDEVEAAWRKVVAKAETAIREGEAEDERRRAAREERYAQYLALRAEFDPED